MGLFGKKRELPPLITDEELGLDTGISYRTVLEYLTGLSAADYKKICDVAELYRQADQSVAAVLGIANEPTTSIKKDLLETNDPMRIDKEPAFLIDDEPKGGRKK